MAIVDGLLSARELSSFNVSRALPSIAKIGKEEREIVARIGFLPVGFNVGTLLGLEGGAGLLADIVLDPVNFIGGIGALTKGGKAAKAARAIFGASKAAEEAAQLAKVGKPAEEIFARIFSKLDTAARLDTRSLQEAASVLNLAGDEKEAISLLSKIKTGGEAQRTRALVSTERTASPDRQVDRILNAVRKNGVEGGQGHIAAEMARRTRLAQLIRQGQEAGDFREFNRIAKEVRKLDRSARTRVLFSGESKRNIRSLIDEIEAGRSVGPLARVADEPFEKTARAQAEAGQRSLLKLSVPFTGLEANVIRGAPIVEAGAKLLRKTGLTGRGKIAGLVPGAAQAERAISRRLDTTGYVASFDTVHSHIRAAGKAVKGIYLNPAEGDFQKITETLTAETMAGRVRAGLLAGEMRMAGRAHGFTQDDWFKVLRLTDDSSKFLHQKNSDFIRASGGAPGFFGKTAIFGELNEAGKAAGITEKHRMMSEAIDSGLKEVHDDLIDAGLVDNFYFHYLPRRITRIKDQAAFDAEWSKFRKASRDNVSTFFRHGKPRMGATLDQLLAMERKGILELEKDPVKILKAYFEEASRSAANGRLVSRMGAAKFEPAITQGVKESDKLDSIPYIALAKDAPKVLGEFRNQYIAATDPSLLSFATRIGGKMASAGPGDILVHKDIARQLTSLVKSEFRPAFESGFTERGLAGLLTLNSVFKRMLLGFSAFHYMALTESAVADSGIGFLRQLPMLAKESFQAAIKEDVVQRMFSESGDIVEDSMKSGLRLGALVDAEVDTIQRALRWGERNIPIAGAPIRALATAVGGFDRSLWDYYHNAMKLFTWHELTLRGAVKHPGIKASVLHRAVAEHVNNAFGGQNWENFWFGKRGQQWARLFVLAPDWTTSNLLIAGDVFANRFKRGQFGAIGRGITTLGGAVPLSAEDLLRADVRATFARQYALRAGLIAGVGAEMANLAFTGHFMDQNPEGHRTQIQLPWKDARGRGQFLRFGKQFREPFELVNIFDKGGGPMQFLKRKQATIPSMIMYQMTGVDHFGRPILSSKDGPLESLQKRTGMLLNGALPISLQQVTRGEGGITRGLFGALGLPVKTEFRQRGSAADFEATPEGQQAEAIGNLLTDRAYLDNLRRAQDTLLGGAPLQNLAVPTF